MFRQEKAPARKSRGFPISQVAALGWLGNETAPLCLRRLNVLWRVEFPRCSAGREKEAPLKVEREKRAAQYLPRSRATGGTPGPGGQPTGTPSTQASPDCQPAARLPLQGLTQVSDKQRLLRPLQCYSKSALQVPEPYDGLLVRTARVELARPLRVSGF